MCALVAGCGPGAPGEPERDGAAADPLGDMVLVEAAPDEPPFLIDRFEVTNADFARFLGETRYAWRGRDDAQWVRALTEGRNHPVTRVTLADAKAFAAWRSKRLPTLAEWVRATRSGGAQPYPWGTNSPERYYANVLSTRLADLAPVGAFPSGAGRTGIHDLIGNAWEWTDTVPRRWSDAGRPAGRRVQVIHWLPAILPNLDTMIRRRRVEIQVTDSAPTSPTDYVGEGRVVVGGGFRNRYIPNLPLDAAREPVVFEALQRDIVAVQLLEPTEWRDDVGFRCARSIGAAEARSLAARRGGDERVRRALREVEPSILREALAGLDEDAAGGDVLRAALEE